MASYLESMYQALIPQIIDVLHCAKNRRWAEATSQLSDCTVTIAMADPHLKDDQVHHMREGFTLINDMHRLMLQLSVSVPLIIAKQPIALAALKIKPPPITSISMPVVVNF